MTAHGHGVGDGGGGLHLTPGGQPSSSTSTHEPEGSLRTHGFAPFVSVQSFGPVATASGGRASWADVLGGGGGGFMWQSGGSQPERGGAPAPLHAGSVDSVTTNGTASLFFRAGFIDDSIARVSPRAVARAKRGR